MTLPACRTNRFLRALRREPVDRTPVWLMRSGRPLPAEYRATARAPQLPRDGEESRARLRGHAATARALSARRRDPVLDILTVPDAMGLGLYFEEGEGPKSRIPCARRPTIAKLAVPDIGSELRYVTDAVS